MKLNRNTIILFITAFSLMGLVFLTQIRKDGFNISPVGKQEDSIPSIFPFKTEEIQALEIKTDGQLIAFEKTGNEPLSWMMKQPENTKASDAAIAFLLNLFPSATKKIELLATDEQRKEYGINNNSPTITITLKNSDRYQMILGKSNFDDTQIYAEVIFPEQEKIKPQIYLVSKSFQYALERNFDEWRERGN